MTASVHFGAEQAGKRNMLPAGSKFCQCSGCGEYFTAPSSFDNHRVGKYEITTGPDRRRCLTTAELRTRGWRKTVSGYWTDRQPMLKVPQFAGPARVGDAIETKTLPNTGHELVPPRPAAGAGVDCEHCGAEMFRPRSRFCSDRCRKAAARLERVA